MWPDRPSGHSHLCPPPKRPMLPHLCEWPYPALEQPRWMATINAGLVIFPGTCVPAQPGCLQQRVMAVRRHLLERQRVHLPRRADPPPPSTTLSDEQVFGLATALMHAEHNRMAALSRTPLAGILAQSPRDYLTAWALPVPWCGQSSHWSSTTMGTRMLSMS